MIPQGAGTVTVQLILLGWLFPACAGHWHWSFLQWHHMDFLTVIKPLDSSALTLELSAGPRNIAVSLNPFLRIPYYFQFYFPLNTWSLFGEVMVELPVLQLKAADL